MESVKSQIIRSSKWNAVEKFVGQGIQFVLNLAIARLLSPSDYGTIGILTFFMAISQSIVDSGFSMALVRKINVNEDDFSTVFYFNIIVAVVIYVLLFFLAPYIALFFDIPILESVLRVYAISLIVNSLMVVQVAKLQIKLDFKSLAKRRILAIIISGPVGLVLAYWGWGVWALVWQNIVLSIINLVAICWVCRWIPKTGFSRKSFLELGAFGSKLMTAGLLDVIYKHLTTFAIGKFYTTQDLGNYSQGSQIARTPQQALNSVLNTVTYPIMAKIQNDESHLLNVYKRFIRMSSMVIFIFLGLLCVLAKPIVLLILTEKWFDAIIFLQLFAFSCMFDHITTINLNLLKVIGRSDLFLRLEIIKKTISLVILCCAIPLGVLAICISSLIYNQIAIFINTYYTGKLFHYGYVSQYKDFLPYFIKTFLSCLPAFLLTFSSLPHMLIIIIGCLLGLALYWVLLRTDENMLELISMIKSIIKRKLK